MANDNVYHTGIIEVISSNKVEVRILQQSACGKCHAKSMCSLSDMKEKIIEVHTTHPERYEVGEEVQVVMQRTMGMKAVLIAYLLPFVFLMITLIIVLYTTHSEILAALLSLGILVPYYIIIYFLRDKIKKEFVFRIQ